MGKIEKLSLIKLTRILKALANQRRLIIIKKLSNNYFAVTDLSMEIGVTLKSTSKHLQRLEREGLIFKKQKGKYMYYYLTPTFRQSGLMRQIKECN